jgi:BlaR1 peptidase M56
MPGLFTYILKLSISLGVVYLFYHLVLRKLTFYSWNRWYLLGYSFLSFLIALFNITPLFQGTFFNNKAFQFIPSIYFYSENISLGKIPATTSQGNWNEWTLCFFIVVAGMVAFSVRFFIQYFSFLKIRNKAELLSENDTRIYHVEADIIPFSFGNSIFINRNLHSPDDMQEIVRHEFVHVKQKHSWDILWGELLCIVNWYNPFSWLLKRSIRQNLEFIADSKVLQNGSNKKEYQYLLLKVIGNNHFSIASKFNFPSLKKRIAMMNKMKTARVHIVKFLFVVPLVAILLIAFRKKEHEGNSSRLLVTTPLPPTISFSSARVTSDTTPKAKADRKETHDRGIDNFEITDKKASVRLHNGKREEYDLTHSVQRRKFETNYGKIISVAANVDDVAPVTAVTATSANVSLSAPVTATTMAPVTTIDNRETVVTVKAATPVKSSVAGTIAPVASASAMVVDDRQQPVVAEEDVLVTITRNTTAAQLEDFKKQMKEQGYELNFDRPTYNNNGILTHISGTIKSKNGQSGDFSAIDFDRVILARVQEDSRFYWRIEIVDRKKVVI